MKNDLSKSQKSDNDVYSTKSRQYIARGLVLLTVIFIAYFGVKAYRAHNQDQKILQIAQKKIAGLDVLSSDDSICVQIKDGVLLVSGHTHSRNNAAYLDSLLKTISQARQLKNKVTVVLPPNINKLNLESKDIADQVPILLEKAKRGFLTSAELERIINRMTIFFAPNVATITRVKDYALLNGLVQIMTSLPETHLIIIGYADDGVDLYYNQRLSRNRAEFVANHLISKGIPADRIKVKFIGNQSFQSSGKSSDDRWRNRRTEFTILLAG
jgi:outer membrane protein OmpA-like peptidoglycan-associated protein